MDDSLVMAHSPMSVAPPLAEDVFRALGDRLASRADDLARLVAGGFAFEEWLNWEFVLACAARASWHVTPHPAYVALGAKSNEHGDLLVRDTASKAAVLVETGLLHDYTGDAWIPRIEGDAQKLRTAFHEQILPMHVIVCASAVDLGADDAWGKWLAKVPSWNRADALERKLELPPSGSIVLRAWVAERGAAEGEG